jgi:1,2-diacylglycerol 3-beta-glucosyltransferase
VRRPSALVAASVVAAWPAAYLLVLLAAAAVARRESQPGRPGALPPRLAVIVPAHDEEAGIGATLDSLAAAGCTPVVVADNCTDGTAERARAAGATVWERRDEARLGKGHALAWAFERVLAELPEVQVVAVVDADCTVSENLLEALGERIASGARAAQTSYSVSNPFESPAAAVRFAGFALINYVRPLGKSRLGLSCGLLGTGMAFDVRLLRDQPWGAFDVTEDSEYHLRLVAAGERVAFVADAWVASPMPVSLAEAQVQRERWESGGFELARSRARALIATGVRERDLNRVSAGLELLVPPQSLLMAANAGLAVVGAATGSRVATRISAAALASQIAFVLGGLALVRAPAVVYRSIAMAPLLVVRNAGLYARLARGWRPGGWIRTPR